MEGPSVLLVGVNFAPEHTGIAPYTTAAARALADDGCQVDVITAMAHYPQWELSETDKKTLSRTEMHDGIRVLRLRNYVPKGQQSTVRRGIYEATFALHTALRTLNKKPDVVVSVVPSLLSAWVVQRIPSLRRARHIIWLQDSMAAAAHQSGMTSQGSALKVLDAIEKSVFRQADVVAVVSEKFRAHVHDSGVSDDHIVSLPNWTHVDPPTADRSVTRRKLGWADNEIIALHSGNMGNKQGLEHVIEAGKVSQRRAYKIRFVLMGGGNQKDELMRLGAGVASVDFQSPVSDDEFTNVLAAADVLLVNEKPGVVDMSLPSKLTSYMVAGRPILAAVDPNGATAAEVLRANCGVVVSNDDPAGLVDAVLTIAAQPQRQQEMADAGIAYAASHLNADAALKRLSEIVRRA